MLSPILSCWILRTGERGVSQCWPQGYSWSNVEMMKKLESAFVVGRGGGGEAKGEVITRVPSSPSRLPHFSPESLLSDHTNRTSLGVRPMPPKLNTLPASPTSSTLICFRTTFAPPPRAQLRISFIVLQQTTFWASVTPDFMFSNFCRRKYSAKNTAERIEN